MQEFIGQTTSTLKPAEKVWDLTEIFATKIMISQKW